MFRRTLIAVALLSPGMALARGGGHCHGHSGKSSLGGGEDGKKVHAQTVNAESIHAASPTAESIHAAGPMDRPSAGSAPAVSGHGAAEGSEGSAAVEAR